MDAIENNIPEAPIGNAKTSRQKSEILFEAVKSRFK